MVYAFIVGVNEWVLRQFIYEQGWKRTKVERRQRLGA